MHPSPSYQLLACALVCTFFFGCQAEQAIVPQDSALTSGTRIVSLVPSFTETIFAVGAQDRLVGVSSYCDYPPEARAMPRAGGFFDPNYEAIVALKPDLVLVSDYRGETSERLAAFKIAVRAFPHNTVAEVLASIREVSALAGKPEEGEALADGIVARLDAARAATRDLPRQRVLLSVGRDLSDSSMKEVYASGPVGFLNEILEAAGGVNALPPGQVDYPVLTAESIITLKPDRVFEILDDGSQPQVHDGSVMKAWASLPHFDLDEAGRVTVFCNDYAGIPGPRIAKILDDFLAALHPEIARRAP